MWHFPSLHPPSNLLRCSQKIIQTVCNWVASYRSCNSYPWWYKAYLQIIDPKFQLDIHPAIVRRHQAFSQQREQLRRQSDAMAAETAATNGKVSALLVGWRKNPVSPEEFAGVFFSWKNLHISGILDSGWWSIWTQNPRTSQNNWMVSIRSNFTRGFVGLSKRCWISLTIRVEPRWTWVPMDPFLGSLEPTDRFVYTKKTSPVEGA